MSSRSRSSDDEVVAAESSDQVVAEDVEVVEQHSSAGIRCDFCGKIVQTKNGLIKHKRRFHPEERMKAFKYVCSEGCNVAFSGLSLLREHYNDNHGLEANVVTAQFESLDEFYHWKENEEQETESRLIVKDRRSAGQNGRTRITYYCHRSGERRRLNRSRNDVQAEAVICTAAMRVFVLPDGRVDMTYFPEHWGHTGNVRLFLSKEQRHEIARLLVAGIDPNDIICEYSQDENPRLRTVDRHTIYRVARDFNIPWIWGRQGQRIKHESRMIASIPKVRHESYLEEELQTDLEEVEVCDEAESFGDADDDEMTIEHEREENGTHLRKKALACLFRLNSRLMSGAQFTEEEVAALEAVEQRFEQRQQLNTIKDSDTTSIQRQDMTCILVLDGQHQNEFQLPMAVTKPPKDLNVSIISCDQNEQSPVR